MTFMFDRIPDQPTSLDDIWSFGDLRDDNSTLTIVLRRRAFVAPWEIRFHRTLCYRCTLEELQPHFWEYFHKNKSGVGSVYRVTDSNWLNSFDSAAFIHYRGFHHYLIVTSEKKIDVVSSRRPGFFSPPDGGKTE